MKTQTSKTRIWVSGLLLLPIIAILFYSFAEKEYVEKETVDISQLQITSTNEGATEAMMTEYNDWMKKLNTNSSNLFIAVGKIERIVAIYDLMSEEQRNSVDKHPFLQEITPDLYHVKPSIPSTAQFESWKNEKEFAIWLDGKHISNTELNNFKANDIAHYIGSSVHSNAKSKKFPQPFQFSLYTKDGFNKFYKEAYVNDYRALTKTYSNEIDTYLNGPQTDNSELRILKAQADKLYNQFTKEELEKHNILPAPPVPSKKEPSYSKSKGGPNFEDTKDIYNSARSIELKILNNNSYLIDGIKATKNTFVNVFNQLHQDITTEVRNNIMNIHVTSAKEISNKEVWFIYNSLQDYGFYRIVTPNQEINRAKGNTPFAIESSFLAQEKPIMLILINRHDELLVDDELGTLESIDKKLKKLAKAGKSGQIVSIRYDRETSKEMISNVEELVKVHKFKLVSFNISPIMSILINRKDQLLVDDELSTLKSMENKLKKLAKQGESGRQVIIKHDKETSKDMISKVEELVKANKFKVASFDMSKIPPPPPPTPSPKKTKGGPIEINGATYYFKQQNGKTTYYNQYGKEVDINKIPPPPPIPNDATPEQKAKMKKATDAYMKANSDKVGKAEGENGEVFDVIEIPEDLQGSININGETFYYTTSNGKTTYFNRYGKEVKMDNLPPPAPAPAPESTLDFVIRMAKGNAKFFNEGKLISSDEAIALLKKNPKLNINAKKTKTRQPLVYISKKPIVIEKN